MIKDQMDKKFGAPWHVVVGKGFSYEITYEVRVTRPCLCVCGV
jgi:dynein light chain 4